MKFFTDIDLRRNELQNAVIQNLATHPPEPPKGFIYFNTTDNTYYGWNGIDWIDLGKLAVGDMVKLIYDRNNNDIVDKAESIDDGIYSSTAEEVKDTVTKKHTHSNKDLLDTYTQTETDLADAVTKKHTHSNKDLLDTYTQTETDLADAVTKKHTKNDDQYLDYSGDNRVSASEIKEAITELDAHKNNTSNPHQVTASQVGAAPTTHTHSGGDITSAVSEAENATTVNDIYFRITEGVLEYSLDGTTYTPVEGTGSSGSGDMLKSVYDTDDDGVVDKAEAIDNGTYSATAQEIKDAVDKKHSQNTDTYLNQGGANEVSASEIKEAITELDAHKN
ncbi:MAG TPA: hypothetical protein PLS98_07570, partial [Dictyoglomaceae bacterium]|nr:hypothetical protein [Dictyoglomaceae bacterium]